MSQGLSAYRRQERAGNGNYSWGETTLLKPFTVSARIGDKQNIGFNGLKM